MKHFLVILGLTALVWLGVSMSDEQSYPMRVRIAITGYDTIRYAVAEADTVLEVQVRMSGFDAFLHSVAGAPTIEVPLENGQRGVEVSLLTDRLRREILGAKQVTSNTDSLRIRLVPRSHRTYRPRIDAVKFSFVEQYALYGEPRVTPSEVTLYGPEEALARIEDVCAMPTDLYGIQSSGTYRLRLDPVWEQFPDVRPSCTELSIYLPVEAYVEKEYLVPVTVLHADTTAKLRLYPEQATVRAWVAQRDLQRSPDFVVSIDYADVLAHGGRTEPHLTEFPSYIRPRSVEPHEVQCVVIK